jgi:hypothetical protein
VLAREPMKVADVEAEARNAGLLGPEQLIGQSKPFRTARKALGIEPKRSGFGKNGEWVWALPDTP